MADVASTLHAWSTTLASNSPAGTTAVGTGVAPNLQQIQAVVRGWLATKGADIASATTTDLGAVEGFAHDITGTTTITSFGTISAGIPKVVKFEDALTLTHNATSLILPGGANITTANGDIGWFISEGSGNWRCVSYVRAEAEPLRVSPKLSTPQASTSGTSIDFTGIPSWVKKITVMLAGVSTSGTDVITVRIGDSGGIETTGYAGAVVSSTSGASATGSGFHQNTASAAVSAYTGKCVLTLESAAGFTWVSSGILAREDGVVLFTSASLKSLSAALDRVSVTTVSGTDTFDAGEINILYE